MAPRKTREDLEIEARIRAHIREQMHERTISMAEVARRIAADSGNMTRIMKGQRGSLRLSAILRICRGLKITPTRLLEEDPPLRFFKDGDPQREPPNRH